MFIRFSEMQNIAELQKELFPIHPNVLQFIDDSILFDVIKFKILIF